MWHYEDSNDDLIRKAINQFNWERAFENKNGYEKVLIFDKTALNILRNFISHELIVCDDKDPPCFNTKIESLIHEKIKTKNILHKEIENNCQIKKLKSLQNCLKCVIDDSKQKYYSGLPIGLLNVQRNSKPYCSIFKAFLNNNKVRRFLIRIGKEDVHVFFHMQSFFSTQPQCRLTFSWIELQVLLWCCLIYKSIKDFLYLLYLFPGLLLPYHIDLFFIFIIVVVIISRTVSRIRT